MSNNISYQEAKVLAEAILASLSLIGEVAIVDDGLDIVVTGYNCPELASVVGGANLVNEDVILESFDSIMAQMDEDSSIYYLLPGWTEPMVLISTWI